METGLAFRQENRQNSSIKVLFCLCVKEELL